MKKEDQIHEILFMPIYCDKKHDKISCEDNKIKTGQKYSSTADEDMSDFAIGFYEIVYKDILNSKPLLEHNGSLCNNEYAGDTMNSFNTIANITPWSRKISCNKEQLRKNGRNIYGIIIVNIIAWRISGFFQWKLGERQKER